MDNTSWPKVRLTVAQALVTYISRQYSVADGRRRRLVPAALGIFGHGNVAGLGQALDQLSDALPFIQGRNEQALVHMAAGYAKATRRHAALAVTASIGPGDEYGDGCGSRNSEPAAGALASRRHLCDTTPRPRTAATAASDRGGRVGERRVPAGVPVLRSDQPT